jgi:uncharacterized peroxidase-related enzyme
MILNPVIHRKFDKDFHLYQVTSLGYLSPRTTNSGGSMAHIELPEGLPGIRGGMAFRPETAKPLNELAEILLHTPNSLPQGDRELIATYVSYLNNCYFCQTAHGSVAAACLEDDHELVRRVKADFHAAQISEKLKALLVIAAKVQQGGKQVTQTDVEAARVQGASDTEIRDTVLIAAAFCMYNRYVDGLDTWQPRDEELYRERGKKTARDGYISESHEYLPAPAPLVGSQR